MSAAIAIALVAGCADHEFNGLPTSGTPSAAAGPARSLVVGSPAVARLKWTVTPTDWRVGDTARVAVQLLDAAGVPITSRRPEYSSSRPDVISIDSTGFARVLRGGEPVVFTLSADTATTFVSVVSQDALQVAQGPVPVSTTPVAKVRWSVTPQPAQWRVGDTLRIIPELTDAAGQPVVGRPPQYTSSRPDVAPVDANGVITVLKAGASVLFTVSADGVSEASQVATSVSIDGRADLTVPWTSPVQRVVISGAASSYAAGDTARLSAAAYDATGRVVSGLPVTWTVGNPVAASVDSTGRFRALIGPDTTSVSARIGGVIARVPFSIALPGASATGGGLVTKQGNVTRIPVQLVRLESGTGGDLVSSGIPLPEGLLRASAVSTVRVYVGNKEQMIYAEPLASTHGDGTLRSVLVQFRYAVPAGTRVPAVIEIGARRKLPEMARPTTDRARPGAVALPMDADYLVSTDIVGPTVSARNATFQVAGAVRYDADFRTFGDRLWQAGAANWTENYYDRAAIYLAMWARTGDPEFWDRGTQIAVNYRRDYLEANSYGSSPHWAQLQGVALHYLLTGDERSRYAIGRTAQTFTYFLERYAQMNIGEIESRIRARTLEAHLLAWRLNVTLENGRTTPYWASAIDKMITDIAETQSPSGQFRYSAYCMVTLNYMDGMLDDQLAQVHRYYREDPRIVSVIKRNADYLWTQWDARTGGFRYAYQDCGSGETTSNSDLNGLMLNAFAFTYAQTQDPVYRTRADAVFQGGVSGAFLYGSKQFNQQYATSYRYFAYRAR
jgi:hypothetical protein